jgi:hypothetical protein
MLERDGARSGFLMAIENARFFNVQGNGLVLLDESGTTLAKFIGVKNKASGRYVLTPVFIHKVI